MKITQPLQLGIVSLPCEALANNLSFEEIGVMATLKAAIECVYHDPDMKDSLSIVLNEKLKDERLVQVLKELKERGTFTVSTEGREIVLKFDF